MKRRGEWIIPGVTLLCIPLLFSGPVVAAESSSDGAFPALENTTAFEQYRRRPFTEESKILCLIDRFAVPSAEILYEGHYFKASFAARVVRLYLAANYKGESARSWILKKCYRSHQAGVIIWAKLPGSDNFRMAKDVLLEELDKLDLLTEDLRRIKATTAEIESLPPPATEAAKNQDVEPILAPVVPVAS
ncbi:MAG TPA: hypothetical protein VL688_06450 [Verrucomicrobiae bacterium]|jgi:hypothetical protein|nr:hypothetical protein [Verrucomicrobiae bacterium]